MIREACNLRDIHVALTRALFRCHHERSNVATGHGHRLRNSFGAALAEARVDLSVIQVLMGHDDVDSSAA
jgi:site-specific recombinase XerD